ncbi:MAG: NAD(P)H-hydrate dehydratase [Candidatus Omnitrophota bacterium]|jgi:NAD(P)H-hydrate epimerase
MLWPAPFFDRKKQTHKGDYGHVLIVAGSRRYTGAALLCSGAAMRAGAGYVTLAFPEILQGVIACGVREVVTLPLRSTAQQSISERALPQIVPLLRKTDCLLVGCGMSHHSSTQAFIRSLFRRACSPMVVDADGLNALAGHLDILKGLRCPVILTPHPGEMERLCGRRIDDTAVSRKKVAKDFALRYNVTLILKGHRTLVCSSRGRLYENTTGNPGLATAGSGDVLSGIVVAFLGQGMEPFEAACRAVYVHGLAADLAVKDKTQPGMIASDVIDYLPKAFRKIVGAR